MMFTFTDFPRDRWGRPVVSDPKGGDKLIPYGRPSSFGDMIADKYNLQAWGKRQVAFGMAVTPSLIARVLAAGNDKKALDAIAEDALTAAKSSERAEIGTALHRIIERQIAGETVELVEPHAADVAAFWAALKAANLTIAHGNDGPMSEIKCVNDAYGLAGTFDFILTDGKHNYIADLKTGGTLDFGHIGYAVQLAVYHGSAGYNLDTKARYPLPTMHPEIGLIVHVKAGEGTCEIKQVSLADGRAMADLCAQVRAVRKAKTITPYTARTWVDDELAAIAAPAVERTGEGPLESEMAAVLAKRLDELSPEAKSWAVVTAKAARAAGRSLSIKEKPSTLRCELVRCVLSVAELANPDDVLAAAWEEVTGNSRQSFTSGQLLSVLTIAEATAIADAIRFN